MGKYILYGLLVVGASSLWNWSAMIKGGATSGYATGPRGGWTGGGGGWSSSGSGHK